VRIDYGAGGRVDKLAFYTNRGRWFGPYGGGGNTGSYSGSQNQMVGCMAGRAGSSIDQLLMSSTGPR
jgi:hypothetical protein